jgi:hypothetical protein
MSNLRNWQPASRTATTPQSRRAANENAGETSVQGKTLMPTADRPSAWLDGEAARTPAKATSPVADKKATRSKASAITYLVLGIAVLAVLYFLAGPIMQMFDGSGVAGVD